MLNAGVMDDCKKSRFDWMTTMRIWSIQAKLQRKFVSFGLVFFMLLIDCSVINDYFGVDTYVFTYLFVVIVCEFQWLTNSIHQMINLIPNTIDGQRFISTFISDITYFSFFLVCAILGASGASWLVSYSVVFIVLYIFFFLVDEHATYSREQKGRFIFVILFLAVGALLCSFAASHSSVGVKIMLCVAFFATVLFPSALVGFVILFIFRIHF